MTLCLFTPRLIQHHTKKPPETIISPISKEKPRVDIQSLQCYMALPSRHTRGNTSLGITRGMCASWQLISDWERTGMIPTNTQILADCISPHSGTQVEIPASGSAHLQSSADGPIWLGSLVDIYAWYKAMVNKQYWPWNCSTATHG